MISFCVSVSEKKKKKVVLCDAEYHHTLPEVNKCMSTVGLYSCIHNKVENGMHSYKYFIMGM